MRLYAGSVCAVKKLDETQNGVENIVHHNVALFLAATMDDAAQGISDLALAHWPPASGWESHSLILSPLSRTHYEFVRAASDEGFHFIDDEQPGIFMLGGPAWPLHRLRPHVKFSGTVAQAA